MAEPIEMPFGDLTHVGPRNNVLDGVKVGQIISRREEWQDCDAAFRQNSSTTCSLSYARVRFFCVKHLHKKQGSASIVLTYLAIEQRLMRILHNVLRSTVVEYDENISSSSSKIL